MNVDPWSVIPAGQKNEILASEASDAKQLELDEFDRQDQAEVNRRMAEYADSLSTAMTGHTGAEWRDYAQEAAFAREGRDYSKPSGSPENPATLVDGVELGRGVSLADARAARSEHVTGLDALLETARAYTWWFENDPGVLAVRSKSLPRRESAPRSPRRSSQRSWRDEPYPEMTRVADAPFAARVIDL